MARVMVTGAAGFVGSHAVPILTSHGHEVIAVTTKPHEIKRQAHELWVSCDLLSEQATSELVAAYHPTHLIHLAWTTVPTHFWNDPANIDWLAAGLRLFQMFARCGGRRVIGAGTCAEYDWRSSTLSETETPIKPHTLYGAAKAALGMTLERASAAAGLSSAWGRVFFVYGPREKPGRLISDLFSALISGRPAVVSYGRQERDLMHVADVAAAFVALLESDVNGPVNIASGQCRPLIEFIRAVGDETGRADLVRFGAAPAAPDEPHRLAATTTRLRDEVASTPQFDLRSGIRDTYCWWRTQVSDEEKPGRACTAKASASSGNRSAHDDTVAAPK
jgi:nucleoside-diphosphate-sugar epimerase